MLPQSDPSKVILKFYSFKISYLTFIYRSQDNAKVFTSSLAPGFKALSSAPEEVEAKIVAKQ